MVAGALLGALTSCTATTSTSTQTGPTYACCEAADITKDYQPGDTLALHWIVTPGNSAAAAHPASSN